jgi:hypothetical protein
MLLALFLMASFDRAVVPAGDGPGSVVLADVNHDGHPDILAVNVNSRTLTVLLGDGRGHFSPAPGAPCPTGQSPNDIAVGDFNGDGNLDVAIANTEVPLITILLGDGKGGFHPSPHSPFTVDSHPHVHGLAVADFTGDGKVDVMTDDWGRNQIRLLAGDGAGNLVGAGKAFATGKRPYQRLRTADFNHDGKPDVVTTNLDDGTVSVLLNDGHGGFTRADYPAGVFPWAVAADDDHLAVIPYDRDIRDPKQLAVTVLENNGKGAFHLARTLPLEGCRGPDRIESMNGTIAVTCASNNKLFVFEGGNTTVLDVPTGWSGLAVGDLNGDGKLDIVVANNGARDLTILWGK